MTKTYNDMTPAERAAVDQRYRVAEARKVMRRLPARIKRLVKIDASLRAELRKYGPSTSDEYSPACMISRSLDQLRQAIQDDERRVSIAARDIEDGIHYRRDVTP